jgi:S-adenosylmethionine hydrolase
MRGKVLAESKGVHIRGLYTSYAENTTDQPGLIINSFDLLEIFCYKESAQEKTGLKKGDRIQVLPAEE